MNESYGSAISFREERRRRELSRERESPGETENFEVGDQIGTE